MLGLFRIGLSAVRAQSARLQTASHNLANADNPGYSRQSVALSAAPPMPTNRGTIGQGVEASNPKRATDTAIVRSLRLLQSAAGNSDARASLLSEAEGVAGTADENRVGNAFDSFVAALSDLSFDPRSLERRSTALQSATNLAQTINQSAAAIEDVRSRADSRVEQGVVEVNRLSQQIASLNARIRSLTAGGKPASDLEDERDKALDALAAQIDIRVMPPEAGAVNVTTADGHLLVSDLTARTLAVEVDPTNGGHLRVIAPGQTGEPYLDPAQIGGSIGGIIDVRDGALAQQNAMLDDFAFDLATQVNALARAGFDLDGNAGQDLFTVAGGARAGASGAISINAAMIGQPRAFVAAAAASAPGDNTQVRAMAALATTGFIGTNALRPSSAIANMVAALGDASRTAQGTQEMDTRALEETQAVRESLLGVSTDEELIELTSAQRAFQAASKILQAADEMTQEILSLKR